MVYCGKATMTTNTALTLTGSVTTLTSVAEVRPEAQALGGCMTHFLHAEPFLQGS